MPMFVSRLVCYLRPRPRCERFATDWRACLDCPRPRKNAACWYKSASRGGGREYFRPGQRCGHMFSNNCHRYMQ
jgi:hypothetical protein